MNRNTLFDLCTEIAATMSEDDGVTFNARTLTEALKMQRAKQRAEIAAAAPLVQELAQAQSMNPWPSAPLSSSQHG